MTDNEARANRRINLGIGGLAFVSGILILLVTALKGFYTPFTSGFENPEVR